MGGTDSYPQVRRLLRAEYLVGVKGRDRSPLGLQTVDAGPADSDERREEHCQDEAEPPLDLERMCGHFGPSEVGLRKAVARNANFATVEA